MAHAIETGADAGKISPSRSRSRSLSESRDEVSAEEQTAAPKTPSEVGLKAASPLRAFLSQVPWTWDNKDALLKAAVDVFTANGIVVRCMRVRRVMFSFIAHVNT